MLRTLRTVRAGVRADRAFIHQLSGKDGTPPIHFVRGLVLNPGIRAAALMRIAASGGYMGKLARNLLIGLHGCDTSPGCIISGALYLPHPVGIVLGKGVELGKCVTIYQGVTVGANRRGEYPTIGDDVTLYPGSLVSGHVLVGRGAVIGAHSRVFHDVDEDEVVRS